MTRHDALKQLVNANGDETELVTLARVFEETESILEATVKLEQDIFTVAIEINGDIHADIIPSINNFAKRFNLKPEVYFL